MADHIRPMLHERLVFEQAEIECDNQTLLSPGPVSAANVRAAS